MATRSPRRRELRRGDRDAVEEAEPHRLVGHGVMPRRPAGGERHVTLAALERLDGVEHRTDRPACRHPRAWHDRRVGVEVATAGGAEPLERVDVVGRVHTRRCRRAGRSTAHAVRTPPSRPAAGIPASAASSRPRRSGCHGGVRCSSRSALAKTWMGVATASPYALPRRCRNAMLGRCRRPPTHRRGNRRSCSATATSP